MPLPHLDTDFVRRQFPAFAHPPAQHMVFMENAGGTYPAGAVCDHLMHFYQCNKVQPYGANRLAGAAGEQMDAGRAAIASILNVPAETLTLGPSTTQNLNTLAHACADMLSPDDSIVVSQQEHEANIGAWERLCKQTGAQLLWLPVEAQTGRLQLEQLESLLEQRPKLVCLTHSSNIIGEPQPIQAVARQCREHRARLIVDGVSYAAHGWPDINESGADGYCFSTYKTFATHLGVMYCTPDFLSELTPQCHYFNHHLPAKHLDGAGPDHASIAALAGLADYIDASHAHHFDGAADTSLFDKAQALTVLQQAHEQTLCQTLLEGLSELPLRILGPQIRTERVANFALTSEQHTPEAMARALGEHDIAAGCGHFYAKRLLERIGIADTESGVLRLSFAHYNTEDEVRRAVEVLVDLHA